MLARSVTLALLCSALLLAAAGQASATTFCVPTFGPACPNANGNVAEAELEKAMSLNGEDGIADLIVLAAGTFTENGGFEPEAGTSPTSIEPAGSDPLTVVGAGPGATFVTSASSSNQFVVNLASNNSRQITIRDLTIQAPASQPDGLGTAVYLYQGDILDNVDVVSLNDESDGVGAAGAGNVFRNGELRGGGSGQLGDGFSVGSAGGTLLVEDATVRGASWALAVTGGTLTVRRSALLDTRTYGAAASGGLLVAENSIFTIDDGIGLYASAAAADTGLEADHVTVVNSGGTDPALEGKKFSGSAGDVSMVVTNSILRGFGSGYRTETPFGPGIGVVTIEASYSNLPLDGTSAGGTADLSLGNTDADPLLASDLSLPAGSPSVDAGDPAAGGLATDFLGAPRPVDGNGDGVAIRDQGAFEYQPPAPPAIPGGPEPRIADTTRPTARILAGPGKALAKGKAKFRFRSSEPGSRFVCKLDRRKAARCRSPKSYSGLKPGRHAFRVWAIDGEGNKSRKPAQRRFRVPA